MKNLTTLTTEMSIDYISDYSKLEVIKLIKDISFNYLIHHFSLLVIKNLIGRWT